MSFVILQAAMKRLEERHRARLFAEIGSTMKLPRSSPGRLSLDVYEIADQERPPMIRIPEYAERRRRRAAERARTAPTRRRRPRRCTAGFGRATHVVPEPRTRPETGESRADLRMRP